jgi:GxxExxY protein
MSATSLPRIDADEHGLKHRDLTEKLIRIFFDIYNELGHGFLESVYEQAFAVNLAENGIFFEKQVAVPVWYHGKQIGDFRADLLIDRKVIVELKVGRAIDSAWEKQLLNYLRATEIEVGMLFNFGPKAEFKRYIFDNERKYPRKSALIRGEEV